jgi:hypothetical protein
MFKRRFGRIIIVGLIGITTITIRNIEIRLNDLIEETNEFNIHTNIEQKKHFISGMHQPFLTQDKNELNLFNLYFNEYDFLIENNLDKIKEKHSLKNPIQFKSKSDLKTNEIDYFTSTLIVGGAPALISSISLIKNKENFIYLNNFNRIPISNGSAWHLEEDAQTEAPTNYKPTRFIFEQLKRLLLNNIRLKDINKSGEFPWRTIDWIEWIRHPEHWLRAFQILIKYQLFTMFSNRTNILNDVSKQCLINELFFNQLNQLLNNKILFKDSGSIIIAKNKQEINELYQLKNDLNKEGRDLNILSKEELFNRYSFIPNGFLFGEKIHDRVLLPNFINIIQKYIIEQGQTIIDGTLQTIYIDQNKEGGIASFKDQNGKEKLIQFNRCILSLGNQEIFNENNQRLFNVISARGVSILAHVYLPKDYKLPPVLVCGGTNHATKLSSKPILIDNHLNLYLMRFTAGACITPNISNQYTAYYDSTIAIGLLKSIEQCLGDQSLIKPILVYGCNRQVSQYGQIHWIQPYQNIFIQYGAAGGGLTRAPDFITTYLSKG